MSSMIKSLFKKPEKLPEFTEYKLQMSPAVRTVRLRCHSTVIFTI